MTGAYVTATELLAELEHRDPTAFLACLRALKDAGDGQSLRPKDPRAAIAPLERAYRVFASVPSARCLQGVCAADLAAAHGQLGEDDTAAAYAREAVTLVSGIGRFAGTEASANMTLGVCLHHDGDAEGARTCFNLARRLFRALPDGAEYVALVDRNEAILAAGRRRWWQFWKA